jgi:nudix-type nucleoside diphosphatase (YffH/AdpP family)
VTESARVRVRAVKTLSDDWYVLKKTTFDYLRRDGTWQTQNRETYDRGNGAAILLYNRTHATVVLTRQFRFPAYVNGLADGMMIEVCAGIMDEDDPEACIKREAEEEAGFVVYNPRKVFEAYMSPGSVTEKLYFFVAEYEREHRTSSGGGEEKEGEDIEVLEVPLGQAMEMIGRGEILDGKTIMLLQYAQLARLME